MSCSSAAQRRPERLLKLSQTSEKDTAVISATFHGFMEEIRSEPEAVHEAVLVKENSVEAAGRTDASRCFLLSDLKGPFQKFNTRDLDFLMFNTLQC